METNSRLGSSKVLVPIFLAGVFAVFSEGRAFAQSVWKGTITKEGETVVVRNPKTPVHTGPALGLREDFALGGKDAPEAAALGMPMDLALDASGMLYVTDGKERLIKVFDATGKFVRIVGRPGQGPGEFQFPRYISIAQAKNELVIFDLNRVSVFSVNGTFLRQSPLRGITGHNMADGSGGFFIASEDPRKNETTIRHYGPDLAGEPSLILTFVQILERNPFAPRAWWCLDAKDRLLFGRAAEYEVRMIDSRGNVLRKISREYDPIKVTQAEKDDLIGRTRQVLGPDEAKAMVFSVNHSAYRSFFADDEGRLFVQTWERTPDSKSDIYDIFDAEGRYLARASMPIHPDFQAPTSRIIRNGKLYTIEPDEEGYQVVKRYTVKWLIQ